MIFLILLLSKKLVNKRKKLFCFLRLSSGQIFVSWPDGLLGPGFFGLSSYGASIYTCSPAQKSGGLGRPIGPLFIYLFIFYLFYFYNNSNNQVQAILKLSNGKCHCHHINMIIMSTNHEQ